MNDWHTTCLGLKRLPRELTACEIEAFFNFSPAERRVIEERRGPELMLGLALQIGFLRMSGRLLEAVRVVPPALWRHLGQQLNVAAPDLASLRAMYRRRRTLFEHQDVACAVLGFHPLTEAQRRALVRVLRDELSRTTDRQRLLGFARRWLYEHRLLVPRERDLRVMIRKAVRSHESALARSIQSAVEPLRLAEWYAALNRPRPDGTTMQTWLWAAPAKHSTRQIDAVLERIDCLYDLGVDRQITDMPDAILRRYARRLAGRPPAVGARIGEPARTIEVACFLRYCLLATTDHLLLMVRRRVAELADWARLYRDLLGEVGALAIDRDLSSEALREHLVALIDGHRSAKPRTRAEIVRGRLIGGVRPVRSLLRGLVRLPWHGHTDHPVIDALTALHDLYERDVRLLPTAFSVPLGRVWRAPLAGTDRERAFAACEVATLLNLRRALRDGTVWIEHSFAFRSREQLLIPTDRWQQTRRAHYRRLSLPTAASGFLEPLVEQTELAIARVADAAAAGELRVDDEFHLTPLAAEEEDPKLTKLRIALDKRIGEAQLPEIILAVDADVRFSWIMLGREPRSDQELLMVYAGILAHGTALSAAETARMIPQLSAPAIRQAMRWASDERRLSEACSAVLAFMHRHPIASTWGRSDLASSDMMSLETSKRVWQARVDPRRQTPSIGIYSHVRYNWGISYTQPIVLNERQAGAAIDGVVRDERLETSQLAVDTHGYTDVAMTLARLLGFDLCPRLKALKDRHLFVPRGTEIPEAIRSICHAQIDLRKIVDHWESIVHLGASVHSGHTSAVHALARCGSASRGDPLYEAMVQLGKLLRTVFLADYFVNATFRRELLRVLNLGEAVNALKRAIYAGRVAGYQAKRDDEMQAVADALSLLANLLMAWNTTKMQAVLDHWGTRRSTAVPPELIGRIAPTRTEGINLRGLFRFPIDDYADRLLPSLAARKSTANGR